MSHIIIYTYIYTGNIYNKQGSEHLSSHSNKNSGFSLVDRRCVYTDKKHTKYPKLALFSKYDFQEGIELLL